MALTPMSDYVDGADQLRVAMGYGLPKQYPLGMNGLGAEDLLNPFNPNAFQQINTLPNYTQKDPFAVQSAATSSAPQNATPFGQKVNAVTDAIAKIGAAFAPAFKKAPKQNVVIQKEPDYTTYAVIGGAVIVSIVLAIAVGKSGRRKD